MARRAAPSDRRRGYVDYELSPGSEHFLYGKGGNDEYAREVRRVKSQLREAIYGEYYDYEQEAEDKKFKINVSALIAIILSVVALCIALIGKIATLESVFYLAEGKDGITLVVDFIKAISGTETPKTELYIGLFATAYIAIDVLIIIGGALILRKRGTGKLIRLLTAVAFLLCVAIVGAELAAAQAVPVGIMILTLLAFVAFISTAAGGKKIRR